MSQPAAPQTKSLCLGCNERQPLRPKYKFVLASGRTALDGECTVCGQIMFKIEGDSRQEKHNDQ